MITLRQLEFPERQTPPGVRVLREVRKTHDTTAMSADLFEAFCKAVLFYLTAFSVEETAELVVAEFWPLPEY